MSAWPHFDEDEIQAAADVLRSGKVNYWTGGEGRSFEREFSEYIGAKHAVAVSNGTTALELALHALGIGAGDEVVVPARTFIGTATAAVACGAVPVVADVDCNSGCVTAGTMEAALTPRTRAAIVVHLAGWPCDMEAIMALAHERGFFVIEDCAQAHGARWNGKHVGTWGNAGAFSFCQDKIMTTAGEGGMVVTDDDAVWRRAWEYKDHGRSWDAIQAATQQPGYEFKWVCDGFGTNWRMTEVQAAVGRVQLTKLDGWIKTRRANAAILGDELTGVPGLRIARPPKGAFVSYYKYYAYVVPNELKPGWTRARILDEVNAASITCLMGICPEIYREQAFVKRGYGPSERLRVARELGETSLMLLVDPTLGEADMLRATGALRQVMGRAAGRQ